MVYLDEAAIERQDGAVSHISLTVERELLVEFFPILQKGFGVMALVPCTIKNLLCDQFGLSHAYVSEKITTIFLNGKATDSIEQSIVKERSTIALSAAMPGVVGATMRRGSFYASMRSAITCSEYGISGAWREGIIRVKLFNLLLIDLGPEFLNRGVIMTPSELSDFFHHNPDFNWQGCNGALINGKPVAPICLKLSDLFAHCETIKLTLSFTKRFNTHRNSKAILI
jgi:hypothetical protein